MTDELENLRPEVREAVQELDGKAYPGSRTHECWQTIRAELLRLAGECAMIPRAQLLGNLADANERAEKAEAELVAIKDENVKLRDVLADRDMDREMAAHANKELAALKTVIDESDRVTPFTSAGGTLIHCSDLLLGKRVRLVVEE